LNLGKAIGVRFRDPEWARLALVHRSHAFEQSLEETNERLEFLGDAVLGLVVADLAFRDFPDLSEGDLAKLRAATVNMETLADIARELRLGELIMLGRGEEASGGRDKASILADTLEAVIGAVYLDRGLKAAAGLVERLFLPRIAAYVRGERGRDYKTSLQELASQETSSLPEYRIAESGPDHRKEFIARVYLEGKRWGEGAGRSKKEAEQRAAREAVEKLESRLGARRS